MMAKEGHLQKKERRGAENGKGKNHHLRPVCEKKIRGQCDGCLKNTRLEKKKETNKKTVPLKQASNQTGKRKGHRERKEKTRIRHNKKGPGEEHQRLLKGREAGQKDRRN